MRLIKNKKGSPILLAMIVLAAFMALTWALVVLVGKDMDRGIGAKQLNMLDTYQEGTELLFYIEQAAMYASEQSLFDLAYIGGTSGCGATSEGYMLWNNKEKICFPTEAEITAQLNWRVSSYLKPYLKEFLGVSQNQFMDYELELVQDDNLEIAGLPAYTIDLIMPTTYQDALLLNDAYQEAEVRLGSEVEYYSVSYNYGDYLFDGPINLPPPNDGKCGHIVDYAYKFVGCPYALNYIAILTPNTCKNGGLTCATFVSSVILGKTSRNQFLGHGAIKCKKNAGTVIRLGTDVNVLQAGDIFQAGEYIPDVKYGHTGMYVGKGTLSFPKPYFEGLRTCYRIYQPDPNGRPVFIHSIGNEEMGQPGVCYEYYDDLFAPGRIQVTMFCRLKECI